MRAPLARFDDRLTMRHRRSFPHPIERVWAAIIDERQLAQWMLPVARVEAVEGGRCSFTWGGDVEQVGVVRDVSPPNTICFDLGTSSLRFELASLEGGLATQVDLVHSFASGAHVELAHRPGGDQPAGPGSPWRPDFVHGFHLMLDALGLAVEGSLIEGELFLDWVARVHPEDLTGAYRDHIAATCPPE
jgi:uncharacterized protein YndB with AHSA1/START domain